MRYLKAILRMALASALALSIGLTAASAAGTAGFTFSLNGSGDGYIVTGYSGSDSSVTVPDWYESKPVTVIGDGAFQGNSNIRSVALPSTITRIGASAFKNCTSLTSITSYTASARLAGDADENGSVDFQDALLVLQYGADESVAINTNNADVNVDGAVDIRDALILMQYEAGWNVVLK